MNYLNVFVEFLETPQVMFLVAGIVLGYLLRVITFKLHIRRTAKKGGNIIMIETQNHRSKTKKNETAYYFECIENAQWKKTKG